MLLATPEGNLVAGMKWLQGAYTQRYNGRHRVFGHLFQGRYKAVVVDNGDANYLQVVSTYIHLNPARSGLIRIGQEPLKRYRWSSYPWYLSRQCPDWLRRDVVMGSLGLRPGDRRGYEAYLEGRVLELGRRADREACERCWKAIRRGWYLGEAPFLAKLKGRLAKALAGRRRESQQGAARAQHDAAAAERLLGEGMKALGLTEVELARMAKGAPEKVALAWWLRARTTVTLRWVGDRLGLGHYSRVTQAVSRMNRKPGRKQAALGKKLSALNAKGKSPR